MKERDRRIVEAVLKKAAAVCPGALELLGVYGSAVTGDDWEKSDVDLLIVAGDGRGRQLAGGFILEDTGVGYDLYLTSWESLEADAECAHAHLAKLLDSELVFCRDGEAAGRLEALRRRARGILASGARFEKAEKLLREAREEYAKACLASDLSAVRTHAGEAVWWLLDALMLWHGRYFRLGTKRAFRELAALDLPFDAEKKVTDVLRADTAEGLRSALTKLFVTVQDVLRVPRAGAKPAPEDLAGTYEEMVSNWRNKMWEAADRSDLFSSYMNLGSLQLMLRELAEGAGTGELEIMDRFEPADLRGNAEVFDAALEAYAGEYAKLGMPVRRFADLDAFLDAYFVSD
ncbi:MAG: nucleotidyltransferase domain-containing protein [Oscillospiraceae bacterium]|nr:nucleotidyltransferase domain-containing protein [Oscillospiraceae bacterium]